MNKTYTVAIVGATGAVGQEMIKVLERRRFPVKKLRCFATRNSVGRCLSFRGQAVAVEELQPNSFAGADFVLMSAGSAISKQYAPIAAEAGCVVIDNSSAFRMFDEVPLVVPEINPDDIWEHKGIIANPNCTTAIVLMALYPLHRRFGAVRAIASSYQAVSGSGAKGMEELREQTTQALAGYPVTKRVYPHQIAFNVLPQIDAFLPSGYTKEEMKLENEGRKIMHHPTFRASLTAVRVPVMRAHSIALTVEFREPLTVSEARNALATQAPGLVICDEPEDGCYPTPLAVAETDPCFVGRIRKDAAFDNGLSFFVVGDQLLKGAALNAVQIAELLLERR